MLFSFNWADVQGINNPQFRTWGNFFCLDFSNIVLYKSALRVFICFKPSVFCLPACWVCNLWQSVWRWSCKKCIKCKSIKHTGVGRPALLMPFPWLGFCCPICYISQKCGLQLMEYEVKVSNILIPYHLWKPTHFVFYNSMAGPFLEKSPESCNLTVVYYVPCTHPPWYTSSQVWYSPSHLNITALLCRHTDSIIWTLLL